MATHSSVLAWKIPWMEERGRLQSMGLQRTGHDWVKLKFRFQLYYTHQLWYQYKFQSEFKVFCNWLQATPPTSFLSITLSSAFNTLFSAVFMPSWAFVHGFISTCSFSQSRHYTSVKPACVPSSWPQPTDIPVLWTPSISTTPFHTSYSFLFLLVKSPQVDCKLLDVGPHSKHLLYFPQYPAKLMCCAVNKVILMLFRCLPT